MPGVSVSEGEREEERSGREWVQGTLGSPGGLGVLFQEHQGALRGFLKGGGHQTSTSIDRGGVGSNPSKFKINRTRSLPLF